MTDEVDITNLVKSNGKLDMYGLQNITATLGFGANIYYACKGDVCEKNVLKNNLNNFEENPFKNVDEFRKFARDYMMRPTTGLIAHYDLIGLGYEDVSGSRFSPIAAYDEVNDRFLLMNLWEKSEPGWVTSETLFDAMSVVDENSNLPRGLLHIHELLW